MKIEISKKFPSFHFCPMSKIENSEISESFLLLQTFNLTFKNNKKLTETKA